MSTENQEEVKALKPIVLADPTRHSLMLKWYDQQISLAKKAKELAELNAQESEFRNKEAFFMTQMAKLMAPAPEPKKDDTTPADKPEE